MASLSYPKVVTKEWTKEHNLLLKFCYRPGGALRGAGQIDPKWMVAIIDGKEVTLDVTKRQIQGHIKERESKGRSSELPDWKDPKYLNINAAKFPKLPDVVKAKNEEDEKIQGPGPLSVSPEFNFPLMAIQRNPWDFRTEAVKLEEEHARGRSHPPLDALAGQQRSGSSGRGSSSEGKGEKKDKEEKTEDKKSGNGKKRRRRRGKKDKPAEGTKSSGGKA